ncbi:MAG: DUF1186 family protein [Desulfobulbus sp.]|jgi:hypothetical protein|uniref:DUF1186 domain-containing protein n=1 Tax=Desulfobulbus sp. TaxID=895 RepID=UPI002847B29C|nr:DUF1186 domain-containing protein [Desulfobulbus sp.]MDR2548687.1 DUF1186 family protein [Desulfobulbus sp.]
MSDFDIKDMLFSFDQLSDTYLRDEVEEALRHREEVTPHLIKVIETVADNPLLYSLEQRNAHVYAAAILSHLEETAAHRPFIRAFSIPEEQLIDIWGDMTTEILPTFLFRTCGGSLEAIEELIVNREVDQYVRCAAMEALSYAVVAQSERRDEVVRFFQGLFTGEEAERDSYYWANLAATLCDLHPGESMEILRRAHAEGLIHKGFISLENVEEANDMGFDAAMERLRGWVAARTPADVHAYISWFAEFHQEELERMSPADQGKGKKKKGQATAKPAKKSATKKKRG